MKMLNSKLLFEKYATSHFKDGMKVLEIGPDASPSTYRTMISTDNILWDTLDINPAVNPTFFARSEYSFDLPSDTYDIVLSGQVIEHVRKVWVWIKEVSRVCKPGGVVITVNPVSWPYHEAPIDCWRIYPEGMKALYEEAGLRVLMSHYSSLELADYGNRYAGRTHSASKIKTRMKELIGWPMSRAFDTFTIGQKPSKK